jgi:hypothetical protein
LGVTLPILEQMKKNSEHKWMSNNPPFPGFVMSKYKLSISPSELTNEIVKTIVSLDQFTKIGIQATQEFLERGDVTNVNYTNGQWTHLSKLEKIPERNLEILAGKRVQLFYSGYISNSTQMLDNDPWQYELLFSHDELQEVITAIQRLWDGNSNDSEFRENFIDAWKSILNKTLGEKKSVDPEDMTLEAAEKLLMGGVGTTQLLGYKLKDFRDPKIITTAMLRKYKNEVDLKLRDLEEISAGLGKSSKYGFEFDNRKYYWIPQRMLP